MNPIDHAISWGTQLPANFLHILPIDADTFGQQSDAIAQTTGLSPEQLNAYFDADSGNRQFILSAPGNPLLLVGLGKSARPADLRTATYQAVRGHLKHAPKGIAIDFRNFPELTPEVIEQACLGALLGGNDPALLKTEVGSPKRKKLELPALHFVVPEKLLPLTETATWRARGRASAQLRIMRLVNLPGNYADPAYLAETAREIAKETNIEVTVWDKARLESEGFGALLGVNKGSARPPAFILMDYRPDQTDAPTVALVGKGVTFDTGGISIKGSRNMHYMKSDMGGAAAVIGAVEAAARLKLPLRVIGAVPTTDNLPGPAATLPGDVLTSYGGKTIEVIDTDAEGRLILADALSYVTEQYQPDALIDLATLTGSCVVALGYEAAGLFSNNDELARALEEAGEQSGERVWRMPMWDKYGEQLQSDLADVKNLGGPTAGAITAAKFLEHFTREHPKWAHLDVAGVAIADESGAKDRLATGFGVQLLVSFLEEYSGN